MTKYSEQERQAKILRYIELSGSGQIVDTIQEVTINNIRAAHEDQTGMEMPSEAVAALNMTMTRVIHEGNEIMIRLIDENYSDDELRQMVDYLESDVSIKTREIAPLMLNALQSLLSSKLQLYLCEAQMNCQGLKGPS